MGSTSAREIEVGREPLLVLDLFGLHFDRLTGHLNGLGYHDSDVTSLLAAFYRIMPTHEQRYDPSSGLSPRVWIWRWVRQQLPWCVARLPDDAMSWGTAEDGEVEVRSFEQGWRLITRATDPLFIRAMVLSARDGFSAEDAAVIEGISPAAFRARLRRAGVVLGPSLEKLRRTLEGQSRAQALSVSMSRR